MLTKEIVTDQITADEHGNIMSRVVTRILEEGKEVSRSYHRSSLSPGSDLTGIDPKVATVAKATWTPELIAPFTAAVTAKIEEQAAARIAFDAETAACEAAKVAADAAKAASGIEPVVDPGYIRITAVQFLLALTASGYRAAVDAAVSQSTDQDLKDKYTRSAFFNSNDPNLVGMAVTLGLTDLDILAVFELGRTL